MLTFSPLLSSPPSSSGRDFTEWHFNFSRMRWVHYETSLQSAKYLWVPVLDDWLLLITKE